MAPSKVLYSSANLTDGHCSPDLAKLSKHKNDESECNNKTFKSSESHMLVLFMIVEWYCGAHSKLFFLLASSLLWCMQKRVNWTNKE